MRVRHSQCIQDIRERFRLLKRLLDPFPFRLHNDEPIRPFFIVGSGRCGTTLLRRLLVSGPDRPHIPPENWAMGTIIAKYKKYRLVSGWQDLANLCSSYLLDHNQGWFESYPSGLTKMLGQMEGRGRTLAAMIDALYRYHGLQVMTEVKRWGDKTPLNVSIMPELAHVFPRARFVFMLRDPADTIHSWSFLDKYLNDVKEPARRWIAALDYAERFAETSPGSILTVRYESLVRTPEPELRRVCRFLGLQFASDMLSARVREEQLSDLTSFEHHRAATRPITKDNIGKGRESLSPKQKAVIAGIIGDSAVRLGYDAVD